MLKTFYPRFKVLGTEKLPKEASVIVANHSQMHGPIACEFYFVGNHYTWTAGQMMKLKEVPSYAFTDFWSFKCKFTRPFYKLLSYIIAPLAVCVFNNANTIPVYHDGRVIATFKNTVSHLKNGDNVIIFPEHNQKHNHIIYDFQDKFIDLARLYYKKTGKELNFVPMYIAPNLKTMYLCDPIKYDINKDSDAQRVEIKNYIMDEITKKAVSLPKHTVIPYRNIHRKDYPKNI